MTAPIVIGAIAGVLMGLLVVYEGIEGIGVVAGCLVLPLSVLSIEFEEGGSDPVIGHARTALSAADALVKQAPDAILPFLAGALVSGLGHGGHQGATQGQDDNQQGSGKTITT